MTESAESTEVQKKTPESVDAEKIRRFLCASCGADLVFDPKNISLTCPYCGHQDAIPASMEEVKELSYEKYLNVKPEKQVKLADSALEVECKRCGSLIVFTPPEVATSCSFCGAGLVAQPRSADPMICPEAVLPFAVGKNDANAAFKEWIGSRWFAPDALKNLLLTGSLSGVYLPFWTYDTYTTNYYSGQRGEYYYETEQYFETDNNGNRVERTRQIQKTRWYPASGVVEKWFDDILVPATTALPRQCLQALEPWDLPQLKSYDSAYLAGFKAQRYQLPLKDGFELAKEIAAPIITGAVKTAIGGDTQQIDNIATHYSAITFKHLLMPVYVGAYNFNGKVYQVLINGRTKEVQGERPYSWIKITLFCIMVAAILFVLAHFIGHNHH